MSNRTVQIPPEVTFSKEPPPMMAEIAEQWGVDFIEDQMVMVHGNTIHCADPDSIPDDLLFHELVHVRQHRDYDGGPDAWWRRYMDDVAFRIDQEVEAYGSQYRWVLENVSDRYVRADLLKTYVHHLSGKIYGHAIDSDEAERRIKMFAYNLNSLS